MTIVAAVLSLFISLYFRLKQPEHIPLIISMNDRVQARTEPVLAISNNNRYIAAFSETPEGAFELKFFDRNKQESWTCEYNNLDNREQPNFLFFTPDGSRIIGGASDDYSGGTIQVWSVSQRRVLREFEPHQVFGPVALFSDGNTLVYGDKNGRLVFINSNTGKVIKRIDSQKKRKLVSLTLSADGKLLGVTYSYTPSNLNSTKLSDLGGGIALYNVSNGKILWQRDSLVKKGFDFEYIGNVALSPDGKMMAEVRADYSRTEESLNLYTVLLDAHSGKEIRRINKTGENVNFSPDGQLVASSTYIWNVSDGSLQSCFTGTGNAKFSSDGNYVVNLSEMIPEPFQGFDSPSILPPTKRSILLWKSP